MNRLLLSLLCLMLAVVLTRPLLAEEPDVRTPATTTLQDRIAIANTLFAIAHELGHALIDEFELPILGGEEQAADTLASLLILESRQRFEAQGTAYNAALASAILGQKLIWETGLEQDRFADIAGFNHKLSIQRYYDLVCLYYGSDPGRLWFLPELSGLPEARAYDCDEEFDQARRSARVLSEWVRRTHDERIARDLEVPIEQGATDDALAAALGREIAEVLLPRAFAAIQQDFPIPNTLHVAFRACGHPNAYWDRDEALLLVCYELISGFHRLAEGQRIPEQILALDAAVIDSERP